MKSNLEVSKLLRGGGVASAGDGDKQSDRRRDKLVVAELYFMFIKLYFLLQFEICES